MEDLLIFSNGPGEVSTWVSPFLDSIEKRPSLARRYRVILLIHPCQFGSGSEALVGQRLPLVSHAVGPAEYTKMLLTGFGLKKYAFKKDGVIFSLGGNLMHPVLFRRRIKGRHALYAYTQNRGWERFYEKIFVRSEYVRQKLVRGGCGEEKLFVIGDLVWSSLKHGSGRKDARRLLGVSDSELMAVFMPGSREFEVKHMLPVFLKVVDYLTERHKNLRPFFMRAPFVSFKTIEKALSMGGRIREAESIKGTLEDAGDLSFISFSSGKKLPILDGGLERWGKGIDFAVTLPGTNTVQLAYRGIPALVVAAMNKPEVIPIEGPAALLEWVPFIGKPILKKAVLAYVKKMPFAALPNIYEQEEVLPELFGVIRTEEITSRIEKMIEGGELSEIRKKLSRFNFEKNPAEVMLEEVWGKL